MSRPDFFRREFDVLRVLEVHDGDTVRLLLDAGFEHAAMPWLRMKDFSCPELHQPDGDKARVATAALLREHAATMWVVTFKIAPGEVAKLAERYGDTKKSLTRYVAEIWLNDTTRLGEALVDIGLARRGAFIG